MKRLKLRKGAIVGIYTAIFVFTGVGAYLVSQNMKKDLKPIEQVEHVNSSILDKDEDVEVINETTKMIKPFKDQSVATTKYFYNYQADNATQEKSILYHEDTYIQNSGMDFTKNETFEVIAVLDGTVINIKDDELLGKIVEVQHENNLVSSYQSLGEVSVKKNDTVKQGQVIGKSGTNSIDKELGNHLHFELYLNSQVVNPEDYFDKEIKAETTTNDSNKSETDESKNNTTETKKPE